MTAVVDTSQVVAPVLLCGIFLGQLIASWRLQTLVKRAGIASSANGSSSATHSSRVPEYRWALWCSDYAGEPASRQRIIDEIRSWFEASLPYIFLQRIGVMAPLLGVVVTALGLFTLRAPDAQGVASSQYILDAMKPLALGVGGGATIALVNQVLLLLAEYRYRQLESLVNKVLDDRDGDADPNCLTAPLPKETQRFLARLEVVFSPLMKALEDTGDRLRESAALADRFDVATRHFQESASLLEASATHQEKATLGYAESLEALVLPSHKAMKATASRIHAASKALAEPIEGFVDVMRELVATSREGIETVGMFRGGIQEFARVLTDHIVPSLQHHHEAAAAMENAASLSCTGAANFVKSVGELEKGFQYHRDAADRIVELVDQRATPAYELLARSTHAFEEAANTLSEHIDKLQHTSFDHASGARQVSETFLGAAGHVADAVQSVSRASSTLSVAVDAHDGLFRSVQQLSEGFSPMLRGLKDIGDALKASVAQQQHITAAASEALADAAEGARRLLLMANSIEESVSNVSIATKSLSDAFRRLDAASDGQAETVKAAIGPLIEEVAHLRTAVEQAGPRRSGLFGSRLLGG